ncbi:MAG TPA: cytochrome c [Oligoflexia bacterium]|nr:cytochrome c [Oligoflexia bacterium]
MLKLLRLFVPALLPIVSIAAPPPSTPASVAKGKQIFSIHCIVCHGENMDGQGPAGKALDPRPRNLISDKLKKGETRDELFKTISEGLAGTAMIAYGHLPTEERWALVDFILSKRKAKNK